MVAYLDSSVVLRAVLNDDYSIDQARTLPVFSSELLEIECRRAILRDRSIGLLDDEKFLVATERLETYLEEMDLIELDPVIKRRAKEAFPVHVKTLDALHLATALAITNQGLGDAVTVFSFDQGMNRAARAIGLSAPWYASLG